MYGAKIQSDSHFFASGIPLSGVESVTVEYQNSAATTNPLGYKNGVTTVSGPTRQSVTLTRNLIQAADPILNLTGTQNLSGSLNYNGESYGFQSGYLANYSVNCAVGAIPKVSASIMVYDEMKSGANATGSAGTSLDIPSQGSITATCDNSSTNRVIGFDYSISSNRKPYYTIGSESPTSVKFIPPLQYTATVQIDVDDAFLESGYNFLSTGKNGRAVSFSIKGRGGTDLQSLSIPNACLVGENLTASAEGLMKLTLSYMGHSE